MSAENTPAAAPAASAPAAPGRSGPGGDRRGPGGPGGPGGRRNGPGGPGRGPRRDNRNDAPASEFNDKVVHINRCSKVVKGGRRFNFAALVVAGDGKGRVGVGYGKAKEVPDAIRKGTDRAHRALVRVNLRGQKLKANVAGATAFGAVFGAKAKAAGLTTVVFDRAGRRYHGTVKSFAEAARLAGLTF